MMHSDIIVVEGDVVRYLTKTSLNKASPTHRRPRKTWRRLAGTDRRGAEASHDRGGQLTDSN